MSCTSCGHEQTSGKFCGNCGSEMVYKEETVSQAEQQVAASATAPPPPLQQQTQQQHQAATVSSAPNPTIEKAKHTSRNYLNYIKTFIKNPSHIFNTGEQQFLNGLISLILFTVLFAAMPYLIVRQVASTVGFFSFSEFSGINAPSFFEVFIQAFFVIAIFLLIVTASLYVVNKGFGREDSFKSIISYYGTHLILPILLAAGSIITLFTSMYRLTTVLLGVSFLLALAMIPFYMISSLVTKKSKTTDPVFAVAIYIILSGIAMIFYADAVSESTFFNMIDEISSF
ncbi:hypothetical protein [Jeotgalibacillus malaysiensis]|uniref:hypothetical protein n=1 Tax=Jeotgalibacillus malaysiensis TaxID=1508404 RepID=UPI00384E80D8